MRPSCAQGMGSGPRVALETQVLACGGMLYGKRTGIVTEKYFEIVGIVSFGEITDASLCPRGPPTVYQEVSLHHDWIVKVVGKENLA